MGDGAPVAQVIRRFDLTANERAWVFSPEVSRRGEGWAQLTGVRICAGGADGACGVEVSLTLSSGAVGQAMSLKGYEPLAAF